jgi:NAD(P)-dependent dehydrogenase (short-subunit alcohol dehydrogenase family)
MIQRFEANAVGTTRGSRAARGPGVDARCVTETNLARIPVAQREQLAAASPIRRLLTAEELGPTIVFLASAANTAVNGELIRASGGM